MPELPTWLTTAITSAIGAVITFFVTRRLYRANVAEKEASAHEKEANAVATLQQVCSVMAEQLKGFTDEIPRWLQKLAAEATRADKAEKLNESARRIHRDAQIIAVEAEGLSYMKDPDEPESLVERRFKALKEAARRITAETEVI